MIRNIDLHVQIPELSRTSTEIFQDFPSLESKFSNSRLSKFSRTCANPDISRLYISGLGF